MISLPSRLRFSFLTLLALLQIALTQSPVRAQEENKPPKNFKALFNGHDIDNWIVGPDVTVWIKGKKTADSVVLENYFDAKSPIPMNGPIYLQTHTTQLFFRNVFVREIKSKEANKILDKIGGKSADFKPIFNGKD